MLDDPQTYAVIGAAMEVHRILGPGFPEAVYCDALEIELTEREVPHVREVLLRVTFKDRILRSSFRPDFVCYDRVVVEAKALQHLSPREDAQAISYLRASGLPIALLVNFGGRSLQHLRFVL